MRETVLRIGLSGGDARALWVAAAREIMPKEEEAEVVFEELGPKTTRMRLRTLQATPSDVLQAFADAIRLTGRDADPPAVVIEPHPGVAADEETEQDQPL